MRFGKTRYKSRGYSGVTAYSIPKQGAAGSEVQTSVLDPIADFKGDSGDNITEQPIEVHHNPFPEAEREEVIPSSPEKIDTMDDMVARSPEPVPVSKGKRDKSKEKKHVKVSTDIDTDDTIGESSDNTKVAAKMGMGEMLRSAESIPEDERDVDNSTRMTE